MISNADSDRDPDSDPDIEDSSRLTAKFRVTRGSPERQSLQGRTAKGRGFRLKYAIGFLPQTSNQLPLPLCHLTPLPLCT